MDYSALFPFPKLENERLVLREIELSDAPAMFGLYANPEVTKYTGRDPILDIKEIYDKIKLIKSSYYSENGISWAISLQGSDEYIGSIGLWRFIKEHNRAEIGYQLNPVHWNSGIMTEAMTMIIDFGFNKLKLHSIEANTDKDNIATRKVLEKNGFIQEAHFKENYLFNGIYLDSVIFSLVNKS